MFPLSECMLSFIMLMRGITQESPPKSLVLHHVPPLNYKQGQSEFFKNLTHTFPLPAPSYGYLFLICVMLHGLSHFTFIFIWDFRCFNYQKFKCYVWGLAWGECGRNCFDRDLGYRIPDVRSFDNHSPAPLFRGFLRLSKYPTPAPPYIFLVDLEGRRPSHILPANI